MDTTGKNYQAWCKKIAKEVEMKQLIDHFRVHVGEHFLRDNNRNSKISFKRWLAGVFNFIEILEKKDHHITTADKLYKLCRFYKRHKEIYRDHKEGPTAPFDIKKYMKKYKGDMKDTHEDVE